MSEKNKILELLEKGVITAAEAKDLLEAVDYEVPKKKGMNFSFDVDKAKEGIQNVGRSVGEFVSSTFSDLFDRDFRFRMKGDFNRFKRIYEKEIAEDEVYRLDIENENGLTKIACGDVEKLTVTTTIYYKNMVLDDSAQFFTIEEADDLIRYRVADGKKKDFYLEIEILLPEKMPAEVRLVTTNAPIFAKNLEIPKLTLWTANGRIEAKEITTDDAKFETANASISLERIAGGSVHAVSSNGRIEAEELTLADFGARTSNGKIIAEKMAVERLSLATTNGPIELEELMTGKLESVDLLSSNGKIDILLGDLVRPIAFDFSTTGGNAQIDLAAEISADMREGSSRVEKHVKGHTSAFPDESTFAQIVAKTTNADITLAED